MNIFIEKKTNIGFYNLKDPLGLHLYLYTLSFFSSVLLLSMLNLFLSLMFMMKIVFIFKFL